MGMLGMKCVAFVPIRLTSSRLPRKHLRTIGSKSLLSWVLAHLKSAKFIDEIVVCLPDEAESSEIKPLCIDEGVHCYIHPGDANDVVGRLTTAARKYGAEICVLASGDCPLINTSSIDKLILALASTPDNNIALFSDYEGAQPIHEGFLVTTRTVWEMAETLSTTPEFREHQFPVIWQYPEKFSKFGTVIVKEDEIFYRIHHRISVDTPADLAFQNQLYSALMAQNKEYNLKNAIEIMMATPELLNNNQYVYQKNIVDRNYRIAFIGDSINDYKNKCNVLSILIADKLIHEFGCGVQFYVFDKAAVEILDSYHFPVRQIDDVLSAENGEFGAYDLLIINRGNIDNLSNVMNKIIAKKSDKIVFLDQLSTDMPLNELIEARSELSG